MASANQILHRWPLQSKKQKRQYSQLHRENLKWDRLGSREYYGGQQSQSQRREIRGERKAQRLMVNRNQKALSFVGLPATGCSVGDSKSSRRKVSFLKKEAGAKAQFVQGRAIAQWVFDRETFEALRRVIGSFGTIYCGSLFSLWSIKSIKQ